MARSPDMFAAPAAAKRKRKRLLISAERAAKRLDVSAPHLRKQARAGKIPHVEIGDRILFSPRELRRWISASLTESVRRSA